MNIINKMFSKTISTKTNNEIKKRPSLLKMITLAPENFKLEAWIENDEVVIKVKRKDDE